MRNCSPRSKKFRRSSGSSPNGRHACTALQRSRQLELLEPRQMLSATIGSEPATPHDGSLNLLAANVGVSADHIASVAAEADTYTWNIFPDRAGFDARARLIVGRGLANLPADGGVDWESRPLTQYESVLRFDLSSFSQYVASATIELTPLSTYGNDIQQSAQIFDEAWDAATTTWNTRPGQFSSWPVLTTAGVDTWKVDADQHTRVALDVSAPVRRKLRQGDLNFDSIRGQAASNGDIMADVAAFEMVVKNWSAFDREFGGHVSDATDLLDRADIDGSGTIDASDAAGFLAIHGILQSDRDLDGDVDGAGFLNWQRTFGSEATYFEGDFDFSGIVDRNDLSIWAANHGAVPPTPAEETLSIRLFSPDLTTKDLETVAYGSQEHSNTGWRPVLHVEQPSQITLGKFDATPDGQLQVTYNVLHGGLSSLDVEIYRSEDRVTPAASAPLMTHRVATLGQLQPGLAQQLAFQADFANSDINEDYYLIARLRGDTPAGSIQSGAVLFTGGRFQELDHTLHIHGTDRGDAIDLSSALAWSNAQFQETPASVYVRAHGGNDVVAGDAFSTVTTFLFGGAGNDTLRGSGGSNNLFGQSGNDTYFVPPKSLPADLADSMALQSLYDGGGDDTYVFQAGPKGVTTIVAEAAGLAAGNDTLDFSQLDLPIEVDLNRTSNRVNRDLTISLQTSVQNVIGTAQADTITGNAGTNRLDGLGGNDVLRGGEGDDTYAFSGEFDLGTDSIIEAIGEGSDTLDFSDLLFGTGVAVDLRNKTGVQHYINDQGRTAAIDWSAQPELENVRGTYFEDDLIGDDAANLLDGLFGNDRILGRGGNDTLRGGWGDDLLIGGAQDDLLYGSYGNDSYRFSDALDMGTDSLFEHHGEGIDQIDFRGLDVAVYIDLTSTGVPQEVAAGRLVLEALAGQAIEDVTGTDYDDVITGNALNNVIEGGRGNDNLSGGAGDDVVNGGEGADAGEGGPGYDASDFGDEDSSPPELADIPTIDVTGAPKRMRLRFEDNNYRAGTYAWQLLETDGTTPYQGPASLQGDILSVYAASPGTYQAQVVITDGEGLTDSQDVRFIIHDASEVDFVEATFIDANTTVELFDGLQGTITHTHPHHGTVSIETYTASDQLYERFFYTPHKDFEGLDSLDYQGRVIDDGNNESAIPTEAKGTKTFLVGPAAKVNLVPAIGTQEIDDGGATPGYRIDTNADDDNENGIIDGLEDRGRVNHEDDLVGFYVETWFVQENIADDYQFTFSGPSATSALRIWDSPTRDNEILAGNNFQVDDLPDQVWIEKMPLAGRFQAGSISLQARHANAWSDTAYYAEARIRFPALTLDVDIDSDNNGVIDGSPWEERLEESQYGLGKLVLQNHGTDDPGENAANFTRFVLRLPEHLNPDDPNLRIRIDYEPNTSAGDIDLWKVDKAEAEAGGQRVHPGATYSLRELNYCPQCGEISLFIEGVRESNLIKTLNGVGEQTLIGSDNHGKPDERIKATLVFHGEEIGSDEVKYIVTQPDSFFYHLQSRREVRTGLAASGVYEHRDLPQFGMRRLGFDDLTDLGIGIDLAAIKSNLTNRPTVLGLKAILYQDFLADGDNQFILAFAGTDIKDLADWGNNLNQGLVLFEGNESAQYLKAMEIANTLIRIPKVLSGRLVATGHSLGGGLASAASVVTGIPADTFNSAGLNPDTLFNGDEEERSGGSIGRLHAETGPNSSIKLINAFFVDWDVLSFFQDNTPVVAPSAIGVRLERDGPYDAEVAAALAGSTLIAGLNPAIALRAFIAAEGLYFGKSHARTSYFYGLLSDTNVDSGDDILGYDL